MTPTAEQAAIIEASLSGKNIAITAVAGSGKTTTLRQVAEARPRTKMLYIAFNKAIQVAAAASFPSNVVCKTAHSLAYGRFGVQIKDRLNGPRQTGWDVARILGITKELEIGKAKLKPANQAWMINAALAEFCRSGDERPSESHIAVPVGLGDVERGLVVNYLLSYVRRAWEDLVSPGGKLRPTHDTYLKMWQLSRPALGYNVVLYDEAQDADPCIASVVEAHSGQVIAVGDSAQAIYGWRGAGDYLETMNAAHRLHLTQSWRFGQAIADEANVWLSVLDAEVRVTGNPGLNSKIAPIATPDAILCRSNAGTIETALKNRGKRMHLVGDGQAIQSFAEAAERMQEGQDPRHPDLMAFTCWKDVQDYAENDPSGSDLAVQVRLVDQYGARKIIQTIRDTVPADRAELVISTAHKAKGLEWDRVRIHSDFPVPDEDTDLSAISPENAMLAYVAVTRARNVLDNDGLAWVHDYLDVRPSIAPVPNIDNNDDDDLTPDDQATEHAMSEPSPAKEPAWITALNRLQRQAPGLTENFCCGPTQMHAIVTLSEEVAALARMEMASADANGPGPNPDEVEATVANSLWLLLAIAERRGFSLGQAAQDYASSLQLPRGDAWYPVEQGGE